MVAEVHNKFENKNNTKNEEWQIVEYFEIRKSGCAIESCFLTSNKTNGNKAAVKDSRQTSRINQRTRHDCIAV